jgi:hypothetical protein
VKRGNEKKRKNVEEKGESVTRKKEIKNFKKCT